MGPQNLWSLGPCPLTSLIRASLEVSLYSIFHSLDIVRAVSLDQAYEYCAAGDDHHTQPYIYKILQL
jgi:hypothetical protein